MQNNYLGIDFETWSKTDLTVAGLGAYLDDPTTEPYMLSYRMPGTSTTKVAVGRGAACIPDVCRQAVAAGVPVMAHNAGFDIEIWGMVLPGLRIDPENVLDTATLARYHGLPGSLAGAGAGLGIAHAKLSEGKELLAQALAKPYIGALLSDQALIGQLTRYAGVDVDAMLDIYAVLGELPERERRIWAMSHRINARGFYCDVAAAMRMQARASELRQALDDAIADLTGGAVMATSEVQKFADWFGLPNADMNVLLAHRDAHPAIEVMIEASRYPRKCDAILRGVSSDGRLRHGLLTYGATSGRWTARGAGGAQMHNFVRPRNGRTNEQIEAALTDPYASLIDLAEAQRSLFLAEPGRLIVSHDLSNIEARVLPWLAEDHETIHAVETGRDLYKMQAVRNGWAPDEDHVTKDHRQKAKVARLALGFHGGKNALDNMAANYHMPPMPPDESNGIVQDFRAGEPALNRFWMFERRDALICVGSKQACGRYRMSELGTLYAMLPSGRELAYRDARLLGTTIFYRDPVKDIDVPLPITQLVNNLVQGTARDVFADGMLDIDAAGIAIVHHVHDECPTEVPARMAEEADRVIHECLCKPRECYEGLPVDSEGGISPRWRK